MTTGLQKGEFAAVLRSFLKSCLQPLVTFALYLRGLKVPQSFDFRDRLIVLNTGIEPDVRAIIQQLLRPGMVVLDVGANIGLLSRAFCQAVGPAGQVYSFEPDPESFGCLRFNTRAFPQQRLFQVAVSDHDGTALLYLNARSSTGNSLLNQANTAGSVAVECRTLDGFVAGQPLDRLDLIKIDVEGAELMVLRGMRKTLQHWPGVKLILEYCPTNLTGSNVDPRSLYTELLDLGLTIAAIQANGQTESIAVFEDLEKHLGTKGYANLLCARA